MERAIAIDTASGSPSGIATIRIQQASITTFATFINVVNENIYWSPLIKIFTSKKMV